MGIFKKKDKTPQGPQSFVGPTDRKSAGPQADPAPPQDIPPHKPELSQESSSSTFNTAPSNYERAPPDAFHHDQVTNVTTSNLNESTALSNGPSHSNSYVDKDSNLSSADTKVTQQRDSAGNKQTIITTTTTTTTTTVTSDGRVYTEQQEHDRPISELPATSPLRPASPQRQLPNQQSSNVPITPPIPQKHVRRSSQPEANMLQPPPPMPAQGHYDDPVSPQQANNPAPFNQQHSPVSPQGQYQAYAPNGQNRNSPPNSYQPSGQPAVQPLSSNPPATQQSQAANFSRPGGRRSGLQQAAAGLHGIGDGLRGAINVKAGQYLGDDPEVVARHREIRDRGLREARSGGFLGKGYSGKTDPQAQVPARGAESGDEGGRTRLRRQSGERGVARNF